VIPSVRILTFCRGKEFLPGNLLVFKSIRVGFPAARIEAWDNASDPECYKEIVAAANAAGCEVMPRFKKRIEHADWLERMTREAPPGEPLVFVDPDVVFWKKVEGWKFPDETLIAGRYVPRIQLLKSAPSDARLHTSLLWITKPGEVANLREGKDYLYDFRPFHGTLFLDGKNFRHIDTAGPLYSVLKHRAYRFTETELDCYDHVWSGTAMDYIEAEGTPETIALFHDTHKDAKESPEKLKGLWKIQEAFFKRMSIPEPAESVAPVISIPSEAEMHLRWAKGDKDAAFLMDCFGWATQIADDLTDADTENVSTLKKRSLAMSHLLYILLIRIPGNPFFRANEMHFASLFPVLISQWDASNEWGTARKLETRMFSYVTRAVCGRLLEQVAYVVGGLDWMAQVTRELHDYYYGESGRVESFADWEKEPK
jgi:hypothetical protein